MADNDRSTSTTAPRPRATVVIGDYELGAQIGRGSFATVYRGMNKRTNSLVAIKSVVRSSLTRRLLENLETEINILRTVKHESIVELIDCLKSRNHIHLVMEYCSLGDLAGYMRKRKEHSALRNEYGGLSMHIVRSFVSQLGSAMLFLRSRDVIHRDIKTQNILLQPPNDNYVLGESEARGEVPWIKVADFGFARNLPSTALAETLCGSPLYMAPEILHYEPYDAKADLWSIGAVVYEMMTGKPPFHASNHVELARVIERTNDFIVFPDEKQSASGEALDATLKDLVRKLLKMKPAARMSFADFFAHPAMKWKPGNGDLVAQLPIAEAQAAAKAAAERPLTPSVVVPRDAIYNHHRYAQQTMRPAAHDQGMVDAMRKMDIGQTVYPPNSRQRSLDDGYGAESRRRSSLTEEEQALAEREYVVIEKRAVEMNYLADELNSSPRTPVTFYPPRPTGGAFQQAPGVARQMTALARAVHEAVSPQYQISTETANGPLSRRRGTYAGVFNPLDLGLAETFESRHTLGTAQEEPTIRRMEGLAYKAHSMSFLADIKWRAFAERSGTKQADALTDPKGGYLSPGQVSVEEAFVLYLRALSLLHRAMVEASKYWASLHGASSSVTVSAAFNGAVQWVRDKFNECLDRAESLKQRASGDELDHVSEISVVQVLYEQALALSKVAAQRELKWIEPLDCDRAYQLAIWMLSAILEATDSQDEHHEVPDMKDTQEELALEDRTIVEQFIASIVKRRETLQKRLLQLDDA
ncbi:Serine/threonine-protein kinase [Coemansia spiralis]|uniref:non-specific serine/threonine protein kinase n=1 Tax=Coemansia spiralis TaxID=417178 RepID=A0A9W8GHT8_9FUNG|nr:Serine/threonine-protein kinase [Coemansia spiralis]